MVRLLPNVVPAGDTWGRGRYGFLLPAEYIKTHPGEDAVLVVGINLHRTA
ncbi:hypothetical protein [Kitasatospora sp. NPDC094011]